MAAATRRPPACLSDQDDCPRARRRASLTLALLGIFSRGGSRLCEDIEVFLLATSRAQRECVVKNSSFGSPVAPETSRTGVVVARLGMRHRDDAARRPSPVSQSKACSNVDPPSGCPEAEPPVTSADTRDVTSALSSELVERSECILIVDDEPAVRQLIAGILARAGHRVLTASSGPEAIGVLETEDVALVLSDINMPGSISGLELIDALHARRPSLPIVLVTGSVDETSLQEAMDRGAAGFITKPFKALELTRKVETAISRRLLTEVELRERLLAPTVASVLANAIEVRDSSMEGHTERLAALALEHDSRTLYNGKPMANERMGAVCAHARQGSFWCAPDTPWLDMRVRPAKCGSIFWLC